MGPQHGERGIDLEHYAWYCVLRRYGRCRTPVSASASSAPRLPHRPSNVLNEIPFLRTPGNARYSFALLVAVRVPDTALRFGLTLVLVAGRLVL